MMADSIEHVISYWMVFQKFHSPALGGYAVLSHWLPMLFLGVWSGALADKYDSRRLIQIGMVLFMSCSLAWGILFWTDSLQAWHAAAILTVHGLASVFWGPPSQVILHDIVGRERLPSAVRLSATSRQLGLIAGPALGAALLLGLGPTHGILLNILFYAPLLLFLWKAPYGPKFQKNRPPPRPVRGFADIVMTIDNIRGSRIIVSILALSACTSLIVSNSYQAQMPNFATDLGHGNAGFYYGMLLAADAAGALIGGLVLEATGWLHPRASTSFVLVMIWCCVLVGFAMTTSYPVSRGAALRRRLRRALLQFDEPDAGAAQRAGGDPRPRARPLQSSRHGAARLQRPDRRARRRADRRALVAGLERGAAALHHHAAADAHSAEPRRSGNRRLA